MIEEPKTQMMKIITQNPESGEKHEAEIASISDSELEFFQEYYFPENKNPEKNIRRYIESQDISADQKARYWEKLKTLAQAMLRVGEHVVFIGRKILDFVLQLVKSYPNLAIGLALGAVFGSLIATIPFIGWIIGGLAKVFLPLIGGYLGFKEDLADKAFKRRVFEAINDKEIKKSIEQEVKRYEPFNKPVQSMEMNEELQFKSGLDRGMARGAMAMKAMLAAQTESKFGRETAQDLESLLSSIDNLDCLSRVNKLLLECTSSNEFIQKTSSALN